MNRLRRWLNPWHDLPVETINDHSDDIRNLCIAVEAMLDIQAIHFDRLEGQRVVLADLERRLAKLEAYF